ncbi:MAG: hypothetical protein KC561_05240 [Myxococcales bacterium]|nr:hypothetical protein [Myxococcales bacterium]
MTAGMSVAMLSGAVEAALEETAPSLYLTLPGVCTLGHELGRPTLTFRAKLPIRVPDGSQLASYRVVAGVSDVRTGNLELNTDGTAAIRLLFDGDISMRDFDQLLFEASVTGPHGEDVWMSPVMKLHAEWPVHSVPSQNARPSDLERRLSESPHDDWIRWLGLIRLTHPHNAAAAHLERTAIDLQSQLRLASAAVNEPSVVAKLALADSSLLTAFLQQSLRHDKVTRGHSDPSVVENSRRVTRESCRSIVQRAETRLNQRVRESVAGLLCVREQLICAARRDAELADALSQLIALCDRAAG